MPGTLQYGVGYTLVRTGCIMLRHYREQAKGVSVTPVIVALIGIEAQVGEAEVVEHILDGGDV